MRTVNAHAPQESFAALHPGSSCSLREEATGAGEKKEKQGKKTTGGKL